MFADRRDAGRQLAERLVAMGISVTPGASRAAGGISPIVVGLPRGGVVVAAEVADRLSAALDVVVVRKLGCPWQRELGIGAIAEGRIRVLNDGLVEELGLTAPEVEAVTSREKLELERRITAYRAIRPRLPVGGRVVIVVDDGLATGYTARAAIESLRTAGAAGVILAVPVAPDSAIAELQGVADSVVTAGGPSPGFAVGSSYRDFRQTTDDEVIALLGANDRTQQGSRWAG